MQQINLDLYKLKHVLCRSCSYSYINKALFKTGKIITVKVSFLSSLHIIIADARQVTFNPEHH